MLSQNEKILDLPVTRRCHALFLTCFYPKSIWKKKNPFIWEVYIIALFIYLKDRQNCIIPCQI